VNLDLTLRSGFVGAGSNELFQTFYPLLFSYICDHPEGRKVKIAKGFSSVAGLIGVLFLSKQDSRYICLDHDCLVENVALASLKDVIGEAPPRVHT
jgi:hypothetical protein